MIKRLRRKMLLTINDVAMMLGCSDKDVTDKLAQSCHYKAGGQWFPMPMIDETAKKDKNRLVWFCPAVELYWSIQDGKTKNENLDN